MQVDTFFKLSDEFLTDCKNIQIEKGREYCVDSSDKFKNFKNFSFISNSVLKIKYFMFAS